MGSTEYISTVGVSDVPEGEVVRAVVAGKEIAIYNLNGQFYATEGLCTHGHTVLAEGYVEGDLIECRMHGGKFDIRTGKALVAPCTVDLKSYPVKIEGENILVAVPQDSVEPRS